MGILEYNQYLRSVELKRDNIEVVKYEETENYQVMRSFINNKNKMLSILIDDSN